MAASSPAGVSLMSASRAGNNAPPGPIASHRIDPIAKSSWIAMSLNRTATSLDMPGAAPSGPTRARPRFVVGVVGCAPQQPAAGQVRQPGLGGVEADVQPYLGAQEHAASQLEQKTRQDRKNVA